MLFYSSFLFSISVFPLDYAEPFSVVPFCLYLYFPYRPYRFLRDRKRIFSLAFFCSSRVLPGPFVAKPRQLRYVAERLFSVFQARPECMTCGEKSGLFPHWLNCWRPWQSYGCHPPTPQRVGHPHRSEVAVFSFIASACAYRPTLGC